MRTGNCRVEKIDSVGVEKGEPTEGLLEWKTRIVLVGAGGELMETPRPSETQIGHDCRLRIITGT